MLSTGNITTPANASKFKATVLWHNLVEYIHRNVKQKRRRLILKGVGPTECFSGSDVCDTALLYLLMDNDNFRTTDLTREKATKLCQLLLENQIFEPLSGSTSSLEKRFDDSGSKYYKFTSTLQHALLQSSPEKNDDLNSKPSRCNSAPEFLPRPDEKMRIRRETQPDLLEGVLSNPATDVVHTELDCSGHVIQELLGLTHSDDKHREALRDVNGKHRNLSATQQIKKLYSEKIKTNRRSLDCESALASGTLPRTISTGTGTIGSFKRKHSTLDLTDSAQGETTSSHLRRSLRHRRASADLTDFNGFSRQTVIRHSHRCTSDSAAYSRRNRIHSDNSNTSHNTHLPPRLPTKCNVNTKHMRRHSAISDIITASPDNKVLRADKSVEKLAKLTGEVIFSPAAIAEIRQEIALSHLSQIIDLPILEGLVCAGTQSKDDTGYDNTVFFNVDSSQHSVTSGLNTSDEWIKTAIDVFDYMPNGHKITFDYQIGLNTNDYKLALYKSILKSYRARSDCLLPQAHEQIHLSVLGLVMSGSEDKAVLAMRLAVILLPCYLMAEVATLLEFLHTLSVTTEPKLKPGQNNNDAVLNDFSGIFFMGCKLLSMDQRRILLLLMMRFHTILTQVPSSAQRTLEKTMQNLKQGDDTPTPGTLYCNMITIREYRIQQRDATEQAIVSLVKNVIDDTTIPLKDKQRHIKQFNKHHPAIMSKYFSDIA